MKRSKKPNIGVTTNPIYNVSKIHVSNLVNILRPISNDIYFITGNAGCNLFRENKKIRTYEIQYKMGASAFTKILRHVYLQLKISYMMAKIAKNIDIWIFYMGVNLALPILTARLLRKNVIVILPSTPSQKFANCGFHKSAEILERIGLALVTKIILYSPILIKEYKLENYRNKILTAHRHFLDFDKFKAKKKLDDRANLVGYIGRLSEEKGTLNFVKAIPEILEGRGEIRFFVGGEGQLRDKIEEYLDKENLNSKVKLTGWIPHDKLPNFLNELKLLILPSYTEGLPNIMLEAMACGTPVLATSVGAIPDVIRDGETGFIMENNSPECIAENVIRVLNHRNLDKITKNAYKLMEEGYTYEAAVERYRKILEVIGE